MYARIDAAMSVTRRQFLSYSGTGLAGASLVTSLGCSRTPAPHQDAKDAAWVASIAALETRIRQSMNDQRVPGAAIAIIRNAGIAWTKSFGVRDRSTGALVDEDTMFSAQSMSKPVFAYRVMKLWEQGVLDIDAPLTRYTPDVFVRNDARLKEITARRVLSHTTGLPNWRSKDDPLRINFTPGTKWSYSGEGYHYLQSVVTRLTGHTDPTHCGAFEMGYRVCASDFGENMEANILRPFGMTRSGYAWTPAMQQRLATSHDKDGAPLPQQRSTSLEVARYGSAGSLVTTATDYARFLIEVMRPAPADDFRLNESTRQAMLTPQIEVPAPVKASWALGWEIWHTERGDLVLHGGDIDGWHSQSAFSPSRQAGFVILTNGEGGYAMIWKDLLTPLLENFS